MAYKAHGYSSSGKQKRKVWKIAAGLLSGLLILAAVVGFLFWKDYSSGLKAVGGSRVATITIEQGASVKSIAAKLKAAQLIRSEKAFEYYARFHSVSQYLQAGSYEISQSQTIPEIVTQLTHGKVATTLVTILPGQRIDQIRRSLVNQGFSESDVDAALQPAQYENSPVLAEKPRGASLEGYLYPETFQRTATTTAKDIVEQSLRQMQKVLTPDVRQGLTRQGLSVYDGLIVASIVEQEVSVQGERAQAAQVFLKRIKIGMPLGSDPTAFYGSILAGKGRDVTFDSPYNTRIRTGMPPTPIGNVSKSSLQAVANPADTEWLFFVSGDDGNTYFSKTLAEHEALTAKYCIKLCQL